MIRKRHLPATGLALLGLGAAGARAQGLDDSGFRGAGSTLVYPMLLQWQHSLAPRDGDGKPQVDTENGMDYEASGSAAGLARVNARAVEFGASDIALPPAELERLGLAQFPIVTGGIAIAASLRGVTSGALRLTGDALAKIYLGQITRWNDPALVALNPGLGLPANPIQLVRRADGSGTTHHFTAFLAGANADWRGRIGIHAQPGWPVAGIAARGNRGVAAAVRANEGSIGYIEVSEARRLNLAVALLQNAAGRFVAPEQVNLLAASASNRLDPAQHFFAEREAPTAEDAYPLIATVNVLVPRRPVSAARTRRALEFFRLALTEGRDDATRLGFVPLAPALVQQVTAYWPRMIQGAR